jgi:hypothetical protein
MGAEESNVDVVFLKFGHKSGKWVLYLEGADSLPPSSTCIAERRQVKTI